MSLPIMDNIRASYILRGHFMPRHRQLYIMNAGAVQLVHFKSAFGGWNTRKTSLMYNFRATSAVDSLKGLEVQAHHLISLGGWNDVIHLSIYLRSAQAAGAADTTSQSSLCCTVLDETFCLCMPCACKAILLTKRGKSQMKQAFDGYHYRGEPMCTNTNLPLHDLQLLVGKIRHKGFMLVEELHHSRQHLLVQCVDVLLRGVVHLVHCTNPTHLVEGFCRTVFFFHHHNLVKWFDLTVRVNPVIPCRNIHGHNQDRCLQRVGLRPLFHPPLAGNRTGNKYTHTPDHSKL
jgi:hypothetical protein